MWARASFTVHGSRVGGRGTRRAQSAGRSRATRRARVANSRRVRATTSCFVWRMLTRRPDPPWGRKGNIPANSGELEKLTAELWRRGGFANVEELEQFLHGAGL